MNHPMNDTNSNFTDLSCQDFIGVLSSKSPIPGGGGASALAGALGIALGGMVASLTVGKKAYADVEEEFLHCQKQADEIAAQLLNLVEKDAAVFAPLSQAYRMPKTTQKEIDAKSAAMETALKEACDIPLEIMRVCGMAIDLMECFAKKGSKLAISDAGAGAVLLKSALQSASLNIYINTKSMKDKETANAYLREADTLLKSYESKADSIFQFVCTQIKN